MIDNFPKEHMPYIGQSKVWEKLGFYDKASEMLTKGIALIPTPDKPPYTGHLQYLQGQSNEANLKPYANTLEQMRMFYIGGTFANKYQALTMRYGKSSYGARESQSISVSLANYDGTFKISLGNDFFKRSRFFVGGLGFSIDAAKQKSSYTVKVMGGCSLLYGDYSQSLDIILSLGTTGPIGSSEGEKPSSVFSLSVGRSLYFGKTKKTKTL